MPHPSHPSALFRRSPIPALAGGAVLGLAGLLGAGFTIPQLFLVTALLNAVVAIYIYSLVLRPTLTLK